MIVWALRKADFFSVSKLAKKYFMLNYNIDALLFYLGNKNT